MKTKKTKTKKTYDKNNLGCARSESSFYSTPPNSARRESSKKKSNSNDELERRVYFPDVANILEPKNETEAFFEYLKNNIEEFFPGQPDIFDSDLKEFVKDIAAEEKENIDYKLLSREILTPSRKTFSFLQRHGDLYKFWINVLDHKSSDKVKLQQAQFLKELMNKSEVYKKFKESKKKIRL